MKECINCGCPLDDEARFCGECGTKQPEQAIKCANCGAELNANAKFCMECGTPVAAKGPSAPVATAAATQPQHDENVSVSQPDKDTVSLTIKGITFNLKRVKGRCYHSKNEVLDFLIGETPVTQALWFVLMEDNPSEDKGNINFPVTNIDTSLATAFMLKLQKLTGVKFELPTKEQWKYAYKGGAKSKGYKYAGGNDISEIGWTDGKLHPVGELQPNELGVADMVGNVEELLKGKEWSHITPDNQKKRDDNNLSGLRVVVNIPVEPLSDKGTPLQMIVSGLQEEMRSEIERIKEENRRKQELARQKAEEEARIKAAEEARRKAEEEARRKKAEEEARIKAAEAAKRKAEEEARRKKAEEQARIRAEKEAKAKAEREAKQKAEREARQREEARVKAENDARIKAEKEARCKELEALLPGLQLKDEELGHRLETLQNELTEKQTRLSDLESTIADCDKILADIEQKGEALERRYRVVLTKRVESGLFNNKGAVFDARLCEITGANKEQLKEWYQELKKAKRVIISDAVECIEAASWKIGIEDAGGEAEIGNDIDDEKADQLKKEYKTTYEEKYTVRLNSENDIEELTPAIEELAGQTKALLAEYKPAHLEYKKCKLEIDYLSSGHSLDDFMKESDADSDNSEALLALFGDKYESFKKAEEEARIKAEEEARKKAEEEARRKAKAEKEKLKAELRKKVKGVVRYSSASDESVNTFFKLTENTVNDSNDIANKLLAEIEAASDSGKISWKEYFTEYYEDTKLFGVPKGNFNKTDIKYGTISFGNSNILVIKGKGQMPNCPSSKFMTSGENRGNGWAVVDEVNSFSFKTKIRYLVILGDITAIGARNFMEFKEIKHIIIPDTVERIGFCAFLSSESLNYIKLPANLNTISDGAFYGAGLRQLFIPENVKLIEKESFCNCDSLSSVLIPASAKVEDGAFNGCEKL